MTTLHKRISTEAYQALRDALPVIVWYKKSFNRYLRTALRRHPEVLAGINFEASKREVSDEVVDRLMQEEHLYRDTTLRLMMEVANLLQFPELERHEDSDRLLKQATDAVAELKRHTEAHEQLIIERERLEAERAAYLQQAELQRRFADELEELKAEFLRLTALGENHAQRRGRDFEPFLNRLFDLFDLEPRLSYNLEREQIDGAFSFDTDDYVIEAKWTKAGVSRADADIFASKVKRKGKNALGLLVSVNGFSQDAIEEYSRSTPFMTMDGADMYCVLDQRARLDDLLRRKKRYANETGECYFPVSRLFE
jgi:Restriction endonuclease